MSGIPVGLKRVRLLDTRPSQAGAFIEESVWIPLTELRSRTSELPPPHETVLVADTGSDAEFAAEILNELGRKVNLVKDVRYSDAMGRGRLWEPNPLLQRFAPTLDGGRAIDIGSGNARDSVFLADRGWKVLALDRLPSSALQAGALADRYLTRADRERIHFEVGNALAWETHELYDLALLFFLWDERVVPKLLRWLRPGAVVLIEVFTETHRSHFGKPKSGFVIDEDDLIEQLEGFVSITVETGWHRGRHTVQGAFRVSQTPLT